MLWAGLIQLSSYYSSTGSGAADGYLESTSLKHGSGGTPVLQSHFEYTTRTAGDVTIYPVSKQTQYRNDDGSGEIDTTISFTWYSGTVQVKEQTTTLPVVPTTQNGADTASTLKSVFDERGELAWSMDARGFITRTIHDIATGAVLRRIVDADTSLLTGVPTGWSTPSGGGKHLIYDYEIDSLGRTIQELGPEHTIDIGGTDTLIRRATVDGLQGRRSPDMDRWRLRYWQRSRLHLHPDQSGHDSAT